MGILNVNKPRTWTSHDVVARVRRLAGQKRVGHAGTLDPMAEGVLAVLLGRATRLADFIQQGRKTYRAVVTLGTGTDTDDADGAVTAMQAVPPLTRKLLEQVLGSFVGETLQAPPSYSALKVNGRRAYAMARAGNAVALAARPVTMYEIDLLDWSAAQLELEVTCSKGTYIRALARDIAAALGTVGHLSRLIRTRVASFSLDEALTLEEIAARGVASVLQSASRALPEAASFAADAAQSAKLCRGQAVTAPGLYAERVWVYDPAGMLLCLGSADGALLRPKLAL